MTARLPRITFGMIVLNGEPFTRYNLRALYPFAHQIIVAEGASPRATHAATPDGHSVDATLAVLRRFKAEEDPEDKLLIVTAEDEGHPNGFWPGEKDQQSQAYAQRATGDWLWQIDSDEFYHPADIARVAAYLGAHPELTCMTFDAHHFWGGFDYLVEGGLFIHRLFQGEPWGVYRRVLRWGPGYRYLTHRPPTVGDEQGVDITPRRMRCASRIWPQRPPRMFHYLLLFPEQFTRKGAYYQQQGWSWEQERLRKNLERLHAVNLGNGFSIYDQYGTRNWLRRFRGAHPPQIEQMRADIAAGKVAATLRRTDDIEQLLRSPAYRARVPVFALAERLRTLRAFLVWRLWLLPRSKAAGLVARYGPARLKARLPERVRERAGQEL
jgi:hypothetical protein